MDKFLYWTFWPSTVFTAEAARDLTLLFTKDEQLKEILRKSEIYATEEVILPTLVALLGYRIVANPCSYDFVKFRAKYVCDEIARAFEKSDVFWIHPISRHYNDPLRKYIRTRFDDYIRICGSGGAMGNEPAKDHRDLLLTMPILKQMRTIEGWLDEEEADLLIAAADRAFTELSAKASIVEVGSYCGRSTVVLGSVIKRLGKSAKIYAIDPHDGVVGAADQKLEKMGETFEKFSRNIARAGLTELVEAIRKYSVEVEWHNPIGFLFIDGLHDYINVASDFHHFEPTVVEGGYVAFHDYADYYPGVKTFVNELLATGQYEWIECVRSMIVLRKKGCVTRSSVRDSKRQQCADVNVTGSL
jgi:predicted O-methyltransferase YrrM